MEMTMVARVVSWMIPAVLTVFVVFSLSGRAFAQAKGADDAAADLSALSELSTFLMDSVARRAYAKEKGGQALQVNSYVENFPPYAQKELMEIVMIIMRESKAGAMKHVDSFKQQGPEAAMSSFSPAVRSRLDALVRKLKADPQFMNPKNQEKMKQTMPSLGGKTS
jgi:hypothetical protein